MGSRVGICALCLEVKELRDSHLLPAGILRLLRDDSMRNPNPYLMSLEHVGQTSSQAKQYLLCQDCEQRLGRNGESWVTKHCYHEDTRGFRLRDLLKRANPILSGPHGGAYNASQITAIDIEKLVYFSASVVWRASLRPWRVHKQVYDPIQVHAEDREELRKYLLGKAPFPQNAVSVVYVSTSEVPPLTAGFPDSIHDARIEIHRFYIPGIWFHLGWGDGLTDDHRQMCILRSPFHPICLHVMGDALIHEIGFRLYWNSKSAS